MRNTFRGRGSVCCCVLLVTFLLLTACGKKGDPTLKSYEKPEAPSQLAALFIPTEVVLTWQFPKAKEESIKDFYLMRASLRPSPAGTPLWSDFEKLALLKNSDRSFSDKDVQLGGSYKYKVVSQNLRGITGKDSNTVEVKQIRLLDPPGDLSFRVQDNSVMLTWKGPGEPVAYNVYKTFIKGTYAASLNKKPLKENSFTDAFDPGKTAYYTVRSVSVEEVVYESAASKELRVSPSELIPSSPLALQAVATADSVVLVWGEPSEKWITGYRVYREISRKEGFVLLGETPVPSFTDKDRPLTKRNYRVTAVGPVEEGPPAEVRNVIYIKPR
ncbi:MAG TPA: hypothetical protein VK435_07675 [Thermodesulfovibrionales bacterium]|nr:hypothetical protein [Thermodesulfovibrionales bacterium]